MKTLIHRANTRGHVNHGWLDSNFTFSFAEYYNPDRVHFGKLRVINDDVIAPKMGFGMHPHKNMEIISIPLGGALKHEDNTGNVEVIKHGEIQVMTAGTGIWHSEFNASENEEAKLLQVWIFPELDGLEPTYETKAFDFEGMQNDFLLFAAPKNMGGGQLTINQQAYLSYGKTEKQGELNYSPYNKQNGVYLFVISGSLGLDFEILNARDGMQITDFENIPILGLEQSKFVIFEVPLK